MILKKTAIVNTFRLEHNLSLEQYGFCDFIYYASKFENNQFQGWCCLKIKCFEDEFEVSKQTILHWINKLVTDGFLEKHKLFPIYKTTQKWNFVYTLGCPFLSEIVNNKPEYFLNFSTQIESIYVYIIKLSNRKEEFIKIGISYSLDKRIKQLKMYGYKIEKITVFTYDTAKEAKIKEKELHELYRHFKYIPSLAAEHDLLWGGYTECFNINITDYLEY